MYNNPYNFYPYMNGMNGINASGMMGARNLGTAALGQGIARNAIRPGLFQSIRNIKWGTILTNTQKTLNVINQAIPVYYQIKPIASNLRSFGKIMSAFNSSSDNSSSNNINNNIENANLVNEKEDANGLPTFFIN